MLGRSSLMAAAALAAAGLGGMVVVAQPGEAPGISPSTQKQMAREATKPSTSGQPSSMRSMLGTGYGGWGSRSSWRRAKPGWTNRHVQRMAIKKRNKARHRAASKG